MVDDEEPDEHSLAALSWAVRLPGLERIEVSHADFVPGVAAGPVREPGLESDEAVSDDDELVRHAIEQATGGSGVPPNGAEVVPVVAAGTGAFALIEASRDADLVVIGTRGRRRFIELLVRLHQPRRPLPLPLPRRRHPLTRPIRVFAAIRVPGARRPRPRHSGGRAPRP